MMKYLLLAAALWSGAALADADQDTQLCNNHNAAGAVEACTAIIEAGKVQGADLASVYLNRGIGYVRAQQLALAKRDFTQAIALAPDFSPAYIDRANADLGMTDFAGAIADLDQVEKLKPNDPAMFMLRCQARTRWGQELDRAENDCDRAVALSQTDARYTDFRSAFLYQRAMVRFHRAEYAGAVDDAGAAHTLDPNNKWALYVLGAAEHRNGDAAGGDRDMAVAESAFPGVGARLARSGITP
ncbi:MAG TPA: hypothetical protein VGG48_09800 [Rhizomicrobium sp.]